jgi:hypothetical protein
MVYRLTKYELFLILTPPVRIFSAKVSFKRSAHCPCCVRSFVIFAQRKSRSWVSAAYKSEIDLLEKTKKPQTVVVCGSVVRSVKST